MRGRYAKHLRPLRPRVLRGAAVGRTRQHFELTHGRSALPQRRAQAVGAGVAAADDHDLLSFSRDAVARRELVSFAAAVLRRQEVHREMDPFEVASGYTEVSWRGRAAGQDDRVV